MPREDRRITFEMDEVYKAVYALSLQKSKNRPPPGIIRGIDETGDAGDTLVFHIVNEQTSEESTLEYTRDFLAAALMMFCRGCGIPLPRSARKSVIITKENVVLRVEI